MVQIHRLAFCAFFIQINQNQLLAGILIQHAVCITHSHHSGSNQSHFSIVYSHAVLLFPKTRISQFHLPVLNSCPVLHSFAFSYMRIVYAFMIDSCASLTVCLLSMRQFDSFINSFSGAQSRRQAHPLRQMHSENRYRPSSGSTQSYRISHGQVYRPHFPRFRSQDRSAL